MSTPFSTLYSVGSVIRGRENGCTAAIASEPRIWFQGARRMQTVQVLFYGDSPEETRQVSMPTKEVVRRYEPTGLQMPVSQGW